MIAVHDQIVDQLDEPVEDPAEDSVEEQAEDSVEDLACCQIEECARAEGMCDSCLVLFGPYDLVLARVGVTEWSPTEARAPEQGDDAADLNVAEPT